MTRKLRTVLVTPVRGEYDFAQSQNRSRGRQYVSMEVEVIDGTDSSRQERRNAVRASEAASHTLQPIYARQLGVRWNLSHGHEYSVLLGFISRCVQTICTPD